MDTPNHICFIYLYRDGSNYKAWGQVVFRNPEGLTVDEVDLRLRKAFELDGIFTADQIDIPEVFLYADGNVDSDDHCFHTYNSVESTSDDPTDLHNRTISKFPQRVEFASEKGWEVFHPSFREFRFKYVK